MYKVAKTVFYPFRGSRISRFLKSALPVEFRWFLLHRLSKSVVKGQVRSRVDENTVMLADYPRCGVNWLRFLLATALHYERVGELRKLSFEEMYEYAPTIADAGHFKPYRFGNGTTLLKTHTRYYPAFKRGIVIYRDPYEAMKSLYAITEWEGGQVEIRPIKGLSDRQAFLFYWAREFVDIHQSWAEAISANPGNFLVVRYEAMCRDPVPFILPFLNFLKLDTSKWSAAQIHELGRMYTRRHANWTSDEMMQFRQNKFEELGLYISADALRSIDPHLESQVSVALGRMDQLQFHAENKRASLTTERANA